MIGLEVFSEFDIAFVRAVRQAVKDKGRDFKYELVDCQYFDNNGLPSCLIGYGLAGAGFSKNDLEGLNHHHNLNYETCLTVLPLLGFNPCVTSASYEAQVHQDRQEEWGVAVDHFEDILENYGVVID